MDFVTFEIVCSLLYFSSVKPGFTAG